MNTSVKIATWNINSVRLRIELVKKFLAAYSPDLLCLQETKVMDELFPREEFRALGYVHHAINGQKGYHGVAILSRLPLRKTDALRFCHNADSRHVSVLLENGLELHNFYVPAGGDIPDPDENPKFAHKLAFLREMDGCFGRLGKSRDEPMVLVGDLNVAPLENDVWSHKQMLGVVSHTPVETGLLTAARETFEWIDVTRSFVPEGEKIYSWWSYRAREWDVADRGRRLDHVWVSRGLRGCATGHGILKEARGWMRPSDHVPVMVTVSL
ncbi:MAG TPA: exodeoxyribonuclease III [Micropepsaceae bacterium]|nr:exodeoxyribonuclease III [Micropepsaceae bacterium]